MVVGASCSLYSPTAIEVLGEHDFDYLFVDLEHNGPSVWDSLAVQELVRAADSGDVELLLRLPSASEGNHGPMIRTVLDTGVRNVVLPRLKTVSEVKAAIESTKFRYEGAPGERGVGVGRGSSWGKEISGEWVSREDSTVLCGVMVETVEALENIEEIVSVPDLGFVLIGSMDLSVSLGVPTETTHPRFESAVETIRNACLEAEVPYGQLGSPDASSKELVDDGAQLVRVGSDIGAFRNEFGGGFSELRNR